MANADPRKVNGTKLPKGLGVGLWIVQGLLFLLFAGTGAWKRGATSVIM